MDKQEQIKEMAKIIDVDCGECYTCKYYESTKVNCGCLFQSELLYNAGYRKIPENAVVLTDKKDIQQLEWSKLCNKMGIFKLIEKERKKMAKKFKESLKNLVAERNCNEGYDWEDVQIDGQIFIECVDEIEKEITEGMNGN